MKIQTNSHCEFVKNQLISTLNAVRKRNQSSFRFTAWIAEGAKTASYLCVCAVLAFSCTPYRPVHLLSSAVQSAQHWYGVTVSTNKKNANPRQRKYRKIWKLAWPLFSVAFVFWSLAIRGDSPLTTEPRSVFSTGTSSRAPSAEIWRKKTSLHLVLKLNVTLSNWEYLTRLVAVNPWLAI